MGVTINVNGLSLCHKASNGITTATLPDVCKTPSPGGPVPIPYPNIAFSKDLAKGTTSVKADGGNMIAIMGSEFSMSIGDEPGTVGGVVSGVNKHKATWISYSFNVKMEGKNACRLTDKMLMNNGNTVSMGGECQPPLTPDAVRDLICDIACECYALGRGQACLNEKLEERFYNGRYPSPDSPVWREVSMRMVDGAFRVIMNRAGTGPTSNPITPRGGIRPDCVTVDPSGQPTRIYEVKFPGDTPRASQNPNDPNSLYNQAARDNDVEYDVIDDCDCFNGPPGEPVPVTVPVPQPAEEEGFDLGTAGLVVGGLAVVGAVAYAAYSLTPPGWATNAAILLFGGTAVAVAN